MDRKHGHINVEELEELTLQGWSTERLAERYAVRRQYIHWLRVKYDLTRPKRRQRDDDAPSQEEGVASADSLELSPYVKRRIEELGLHGQRVTGDPLAAML